MLNPTDSVLILCDLMVTINNEWNILITDIVKGLQKNSKIDKDNGKTEENCGGKGEGTSDDSCVMKT